jgi:hypothetical protein
LIDPLRSSLRSCYDFTIPATWKCAFTVVAGLINVRSLL